MRFRRYSEDARDCIHARLFIDWCVFNINDGNEVASDFFSEPLGGLQSLKTYQMLQERMTWPRSSSCFHYTSVGIRSKGSSKIS